MLSRPPTKHFSRQKGFTLIELILYVSLMSMFILGLVLFLTAIFEAREKHQIMAEVEQQGTRIMEMMTHSLQGADTVVAPAAGESGLTLSLTMYQAAETPTIYSYADLTLTIAVGAAQPIAIHNDRVIISDLIFLNITPDGTAGSVQIVFTATSKPKPGGRSTFVYSKTFQTSVALHRP